MKALLFYVSVNGNDKNPGTKENPFATIEKAKNSIRKLKKKGLHQDVIVYIRKGTYILSKTLIFGMEDAAPEGYKITYSAFEKDKPVITCSKLIKNWKK